MPLDLDTQAAAARIAELEARLARLEVGGSCHFPTASRAYKRAVYEAEVRGLMCIPRTFPLIVGPNEDDASDITLTLDVPQTVGPFVACDFNPPVVPSTDSHKRQRMRIRVAGNYLDDGYWPAYDGLFIPRAYCGRLPSSPVVVDSGAQLQLLFSDTVAYSDESVQGCQVQGVSVGAPLRSSRRIVDAPNDLAADWANAVRHGGEHYAINVTRDESGASPAATTTADIVVEAVVIAEKRAVAEGEVNASDVKISVGNTYLTAGPIGPLAGVMVEADRAVVIPAQRWPVPFGSQIVMTLAYPAGTPVAVRCTLLGRRGGMSGACW